jgi:hypothetical protein
MRAAWFISQRTKRRDRAINDEIQTLDCGDCKRRIIKVGQQFRNCLVALPPIHYAHA